MTPEPQSVAHLGLVDEADIELDRAALEIAALDHPETDPSGYLALLEAMAGRLRAAVEAQTPTEQAGALARVIAVEQGFEGDRDTYDDPANADLYRVMDRRRGLPIALTILYVALARRVGWKADALGLPGHVMARIGGPPGVVIDPFGLGAIVAAERPESLPAMSNRDVLVRLMMNQATRAEQAEDRERALVMLERITLVAPAYSEGWWERARLELARGDAAAARGCLGSMLETTRDPDLRRRATRALAALAGRVS